MLTDVRWRFALLFVLAAAFVGWAFGDVLPPFLAGIVIAYILDPPCRVLASRGLSRGASAAIVMGFFAAVASVCVGLLVPFVVAQIKELAESLPDMQARGIALVGPWWTWLKPHLGPVLVQKVQDAVTASAGSFASAVAGMLQQAMASSFAVVNVMTFATLATCTGYYMMRDRDRIVSWFDSHIPVYALGPVRSEIGHINHTLSAWLRGQSLSCVILATYYATALALSHLRFGFLIGLATGLLAFVPFLGFLGGLFFALVSCAFTFGGWSGWAVVVGIFIGGSFLEGYILTPKLVGHSVGLNETWVMFSIVAGGHLFGAVGVMLAVPGAAVVNVLCQSVSAAYKRSRYYSGAQALDRIADGSVGD